MKILSKRATLSDKEDKVGFSTCFTCAGEYKIIEKKHRGMKRRLFFWENAIATL
jgi:hypothetical protein